MVDKKGGDLTINELVGRKVVGDKYGIEIEVEGEGLGGAVPGWEGKPDGSLGPNGIEYVSSGPKAKEGIERHLEKLAAAFKKSKVTLSCSDSCSVHVHMNVGHLSVQKVLNILTLYYTLEDYITEFAGEDRAGNLFCLRASDAELPIWETIRGFRDKTFPRYHDNELRYSALNLTSLRRFGTLEFRAREGIKSSPLEVYPWFKVLDELKEAALKYDDPRQIVESFSVMGPDQFVSSVFSPETLKNLGDFDEETLFEGARRAQWIAYEIDPDTLVKPKNSSGWDEAEVDVAEFVQNELANNRFGRMAVQPRWINNPAAHRPQEGPENV